MSKPQILTYVDAGASDWTACLMRTIGHQLQAGAYEIRAVMADDIRHDPTLFDDAVIFVMPGGADLPYCARLNGAPNARIRSFVERAASTSASAPAPTTPAGNLPFTPALQGRSAASASCALSTR
nr:BPL-N domain-containing protein [Cupriavidus oxalaticus]